MGPFVSPQVSYVNELEASKALGSLQAWVEHNPKYHGLQVEADEYGDPASLMDGVLQLMQRTVDATVTVNYVEIYNDKVPQ